MGKKTGRNATTQRTRERRRENREDVTRISRINANPRREKFTHRADDRQQTRMNTDKPDDDPGDRMNRIYRDGVQRTKGTESQPKRAEDGTAVEYGYGCCQWRSIVVRFDGVSLAGPAQYCRGIGSIGHGGGGRLRYWGSVEWRWCNRRRVVEGSWRYIWWQV